MKKSFSVLIIFTLIALFGSLSLFLFEIKSLKSENLKNEYLHTQAYLHLKFLKQVVSNIEDDSIEKLTLKEGLFDLKIEVLEDSFELYVDATDHNIRLHHTIIK